MLAIRTDLFSFCKIRQAITPPLGSAAQGRVGCVLLKTKQTDLALMAAYLPPINSSYNHKLYLITIDVIKNILKNLPTRALPIILLDANAKVGPSPGPEGTLMAGLHNCIGCCSAVKEDAAGTIFRSFLNETNLAAANTFWPAGDTYYGHNSSSRVDYILIDPGLVQHVRTKGCDTLYLPAKIFYKLPGTIRQSLIQAEFQWPTRKVIFNDDYFQFLNIKKEEAKYLENLYQPAIEIQYEY